MPRFLSKDRASLMTEEEKYLYRCKNTIFETTEMCEARNKQLFEFNAGDVIAQEIPANADIFVWFGRLLKKILGKLGALGLGALAGAAALIARAVILRKLKNYMIKIVDWTEYGYHGKRGKGNGRWGMTGLGRWAKSAADKDRESYFTHEYSAERDVLRISQQMMKASGLINLQ